MTVSAIYAEFTVTIRSANMGKIGIFSFKSTVFITSLLKQGEEKAGI